MNILKEMNEADLKSLAIDKTLDRQRILSAVSGGDMSGGLQIPISMVNVTLYHFLCFVVFVLSCLYSCK